jgi:hypothetical protein
MTRLEKCELLKSKGYSYDPETGKIFGTKGFEIKRKDDKGYIVIGLRGMSNLFGHHFAWYMVYGNVDFNLLDHENTNPSDNRICNLRILSNQKNTFNNNAKGYYFAKHANKWEANIHLDYKKIYLGLYETEQEARNAYLEAKKKYHII